VGRWNRVAERQRAQRGRATDVTARDFYGAGAVGERRRGREERLSDDLAYFAERLEVTVANGSWSWPDQLTASGDSVECRQFSERQGVPGTASLRDVRDCP